MIGRPILIVMAAVMLISAAPRPTLGAPWNGPAGLPHTAGWSAAEIETAYLAAVEEKRREVKAIANDPRPASFENTIAALDRSGATLERVDAIHNIYASTKADDAIRSAASRIAARRQALDDEIAQNDALFRRVDTVYRALPRSAPDVEARQLTALTRAALVRQGALLDDTSKARLVAINAQLATLQQRFGQNLGRDEARLFVEVTDENRLAGMPEADKAAARAAAEERGLAGRWVIRNTRPAVWAVSKFARDRALRRQVWSMWMGRGTHPGETDNTAVTRDILRLRGEQARLFGRRNFAAQAFDGRMVEGPTVALALLTTAWGPVAKVTSTRLAEMQMLADQDGIGAIQSSDWLYYSERLRQRRFDYDSTSVQPYFQVPKLLEAMMWAAGRTYGFAFEKLDGVDTVSPDIEVFRVARAGQVIGYIYIDLYRRDGKQRGSWATQYQSARRGTSLPIVALHSNAEHALDGRPATVDYDVANVLFHEFGHTLHTLSSTAGFAGTGSLAVPWDFIETPSLLNERWLLDPELLSRFALHRDTGAPMPKALADKLREVATFDRVFSVNLDYLATAIVDLRLHMMADGRTIDVAAEEKRVLAEIGLPEAIDPVMRALHSYHTFSKTYAAGVYTYLWSDMLAADLGEAFLAAPDGLYDRSVANRYYDSILSQGAKVPPAEAFRTFRGRDPDPNALFRRFGLKASE